MFDNTKVLQCIHFFYYRDSEKVVRTVKDYEIDYYLSGSRTMNINGKEFPVGKGSVVIRRPGEVVFSYGESYDCYILSLDFSGKIDIPEGEYIRQRTGSVQQKFDNPVMNMLPSIIRPSHDVDYMRIFEKLCRNSYPNPICKVAQNRLVSELMYVLAADSIRQSDNLSSTAKSAVDIATEYIQENFRRKITLKKLSDVTNLSPNYFARLFKAETGVTPTEYLIRIRFENARVLLGETDYPIKTVASLCGFSDESFFTYSFRKRFLKTPLEYRKFYMSKM